MVCDNLVKMKNSCHVSSGARASSPAPSSPVSVCVFRLGCVFAALADSHLFTLCVSGFQAAFFRVLRTQSESRRAPRRFADAQGQGEGGSSAGAHRQPAQVVDRRLDLRFRQSMIADVLRPGYFGILPTPSGCFGLRPTGFPRFSPAHAQDAAPFARPEWW